MHPFCVKKTEPVIAECFQHQGERVFYRIREDADHY